MITKVSLTNFKCFEEKTDFDLSKINLFTGLNGRGKSTVLQALLLLAQSVNKNGNIAPAKTGPLPSKYCVFIFGI